MSAVLRAYRRLSAVGDAESVLVLALWVDADVGAYPAAPIDSLCNVVNGVGGPSGPFVSGVSNEPQPPPVPITGLTCSQALMNRADPNRFILPL